VSRDSCIFKCNYQLVCFEETASAEEFNKRLWLRIGMV
jgi:hypothetical protein